MQKPSPLNKLLFVQDDVTVPSTRGGRYKVLVEWKRREDDDGEQVHGGAYGSHALGQELCTVDLAQVPALESHGDKVRAQPSDHGVRGREGDSRQRERCHKRRA